MIDPTRLRLLVSLHERGTLHAAAAHLNISSSAASQQLATLAREVGAPLTEAEGRRLRLTDAGDVLVQHAYTLLAEMERTRAAVQATTDGELGRIRVGSYPSTIASLLIPATTLLRDRHPALHVDIHDVTPSGFVDPLSSGALDLVAAVDAADRPVESDPAFTRIPLGVEDFTLVLPRDHRLAGRARVDLSALSAEPWVSTIDGDSCDGLLRHACSSAGFTPLIRHRAGDVLAILSLVEAGMGVALIPTSVRSSVPGGLVCVDRIGHSTRRPVYAMTRRGAEHRPAVANFLSALEETAADSLSSARRGRRRRPR